MTTAKQPFELGVLFFTPGAESVLQGSDTSAMELLLRHSRGDWGDLEEADARLNDRAITARDRILSAYETRNGRIWIITEADRSATTILRPEDY